MFKCKWCGAKFETQQQLNGHSSHCGSQTHERGVLDKLRRWLPWSQTKGDYSKGLSKRVSDLEETCLRLKETILSLRGDISRQVSDIPRRVSDLEETCLRVKAFEETLEKINDVMSAKVEKPLEEHTKQIRVIVKILREKGMIKAKKKGVTD